MLIRSYKLSENEYFLIIDLDSLKSKIINHSEKSKLKKSNESILYNTNYSYLSKKALLNTNVLSNAGINSSISKSVKENIYLTIDMCPSSKKGFEKEFFYKLEELTQISHKKISISLAITYKWIKNHQNEFLWFLKNKEKLNIVWINHSKTHYYNPLEKNLSKNFMLNNLSNLESEILDVEKVLILNQVTPSFLFRFPGLVSNQELRKIVIEKYSLIPLGTSNWLAKDNKRIKNSDIVLVHGNLNEAKGIQMINKSLDKYNFASILSALKYHE